MDVATMGKMVEDISGICEKSISDEVSLEQALEKIVPYGKENLKIMRSYINFAIIYLDTL